MSFLKKIFNKKAKPADLVSYLRSLQFPEEDILLLDNFNPRDGFQWVTTNDLRDMIAFLEDCPQFKNLLPIFTDNNSNYICVYKDGVLKGKVCQLIHDDQDISPVYRNISNLIAAINKNMDCYELGEFDSGDFDYPPSSNQFINVDRADLKALRIIYDQESNEDVKVQMAFSIMALTHPDDIQEIIYPFLDSDDMYIQERAIKILGYHKYLPAEKKLEQLTKTAMPNGQAAAISALRKIKN